MQLGAKFGEKFLNIYDSGLDVGARGYLKYDDEGVATEKTDLIKEGILVGRLHTRETAAKLGAAHRQRPRHDYTLPPSAACATPVSPGRPALKTCSEA